MGSAPKVTVKLSPGLTKKIGALKTEIVNEEFAQIVGSGILNAAKRLIASGTSPVRGFGRFAQYKDSKSYPAGKKSATPVNLSLTGTMLSHLNYRRNQNKIEFGILPDAPNKVKVIARVHNTGERADIPQRQFIPKDGQEFVPSIQALIRRLFKERVLRILGVR